MTDSALFASGSSKKILERAAAATILTRTVRQEDRWPGQPAPAPEGDRLWCEHGWALSGTAVAGLIGLILLASYVTHLFG